MIMINKDKKTPDWLLFLGFFFFNSKKTFGVI